MSRIMKHDFLNNLLVRSDLITYLNVYIKFYYKNFIYRTPRTFCGDRSFFPYKKPGMTRLSLLAIGLFNKTCTDFRYPFVLEPDPLQILPSCFSTPKCFSYPLPGTRRQIQTSRTISDRPNICYL